MATRLTHNDPTDNDPHLSPDGRPDWTSDGTLAFHRLAGTTFQLSTSTLTTPRAVRLAGPSASTGGRAVTDEYPDT